MMARPKTRFRKLTKFDLGRRFSAEENFARALFALEEEMTTQIEDALSKEDYGAVGGRLREFYIKVCELIDRTKAELGAIKLRVALPSKLSSSLEETSSSSPVKKKAPRSKQRR
jgi:hypothetical protein